MVIRKARWITAAEREFDRIVDYIEGESFQNAEKFAKDVIKAIKKAEENPGHYPPDRNKIFNDGSYRAFEIHRYRIVYRTKPSEILILQIRHVRMNPKKY